MGVVMVMDTYYSERLESQVWFCGEVVDLRPLGDFIEYLLYVVVWRIERGYRWRDFRYMETMNLTTR